MAAYSKYWPGTTVSRLELANQTTSQFFYDISHPLSDMYATEYETADRGDEGLAKTSIVQCVDANNNQLMVEETMSKRLDPAWFGSRKMHAQIKRLAYVNKGPGGYLFRDMYIPVSFSINGNYSGTTGVNVDRFVTFYHSPSRGQSVMTVDDLPITDESISNFILLPDIIKVSIVLNPRGKFNLITINQSFKTLVINATYQDGLVTPTPPTPIQVGVGDSDTYYRKTDRTILWVPNAYNYYNEQVIGDDTDTNPIFYKFEYDDLKLASENMEQLTKVLSATSSFFVSR